MTKLSAVALAALLAPFLVLAREARAGGVEVGARSGFVVPVGSVFKGSGDLHDTMSGQVPVRIDLGYRIVPHVYAGGAVELGLVVPAGCAPGASCSGTSARFGAMLAYHLLPLRTFDPWLALGAGLEALHLSREADGVRLDLSAYGLELLDVELGGDFDVTRSLRLGPVLSARLGRYTTLTVNGASTADFEPVLHEWVGLGVRGVYDL